MWQVNQLHVSSPCICNLVNEITAMFDWNTLLPGDHIRVSIFTFVLLSVHICILLMIMGDPLTLRVV